MAGRNVFSWWYPLDAYQEALRGRRAVRTDVRRASASSKAAMTDAMDAIRTLDVIVRNSLKGDPMAIGEWGGGPSHTQG